MWRAQSCFSAQCAHRGMRGSPEGLLPCWPGGLTQHLEKAPHLPWPPVQNSSGPPGSHMQKAVPSSCCVETWLLIVVTWETDPLTAALDFGAQPWGGAGVQVPKWFWCSWQPPAQWLLCSLEVNHMLLPITARWAWVLPAFGLGRCVLCSVFHFPGNC